MQTTSSILMIRPKNFSFNKETAATNSFQSNNDNLTGNIQLTALKEFDNFIRILRDHHIDIHIIDDTEQPIKPDAMFPNNWVSFHPDGKVILYPMCPESRRPERRGDIVEELKKAFLINNIIDLSHYEQQGKFLEGTGSLVFDHINKIAYASLSSRTHEDVAKEVCDLIRYKPIFFTSYNTPGHPIYHTNVVMNIGVNYAILCRDSIHDENERSMIINSLQDSDHELIYIDEKQMGHFAGNMLEVQNSSGEFYLIMSEKAYRSLTKHQVDMLKNYSNLLYIPLEIIEKVSGGSARCMMAEIFCQKINQSRTIEDGN